MNPNMNQSLDRAELTASLRRLGIRELEERMEISPLLTGAGVEETNGEEPSICCTCKIPNPIGPDGKIPWPKIEPTPTGPTNPNGFF